MGIFDMLTDNNSVLSDREIASDMLKDSKFAILSLGQAVTEIYNPQLRQVLAQQLRMAVSEHFELLDLTSRKDWYEPFLAPQQQIARDSRIADTVT